MKELFLWVIGALVVLAIAFAMGGYNVLYLQTWGVKTENAKTDIYRNNRGYVEGNIRDLENLRLEYVKAGTEEEKALIASMFRHRVASFPAEYLTPELYQFKTEIGE